MDGSGLGGGVGRADGLGRGEVAGGDGLPLGRDGVRPEDCPPSVPAPAFPSPPDVGPRPGAAPDAGRGSAPEGLAFFPVGRATFSRSVRRAPSALPTRRGPIPRPSAVPPSGVVPLPCRVVLPEGLRGSGSLTLMQPLSDAASAVAAARAAPSRFSGDEPAGREEAPVAREAPPVVEQGEWSAARRKGGTGEAEEGDEGAEEEAGGASGRTGGTSGSGALRGGGADALPNSCCPPEDTRHGHPIAYAPRPAPVSRPHPSAPPGTGSYGSGLGSYGPGTGPHP
ncbi:hypothetical protein [Streptomyces sp. MST-110588]|uniref:hypothetical protein n=1 Tax=Streptomyces sp. MST-110588 TaxID=2833628 RepID=UPI001F5E00B8|nr:hypothetical protein [Streptomyces sp. MST-110588]UNO41187.1 hypothetical protein KGS77_18395 [Streptomyces sp. MST-110588]